MPHYLLIQYLNPRHESIYARENKTLAFNSIGIPYYKDYILEAPKPCAVSQLF